MEDNRREGLDLLDPTQTGYLAQLGKLEFAAILNRMRILKMRPPP